MRFGLWCLVVCALVTHSAAHASSSGPRPPGSALLQTDADSPVPSFHLDTIRIGFDWLDAMKRSLVRTIPPAPSLLTRLGDFRPLDIDSAARAPIDDSLSRALRLHSRWRQYWRDYCAEIRLVPDGREYYEQFRRTSPAYVRGSVAFNALR
ncbi:MAG: hypothetical protein RBT76_11545 [candidate division Zixibacteria bacterium]|nr:hypothetical protein [candidate division Zixibacteria bacterium]